MRQGRHNKTVLPQRPGQAAHENKHNLKPSSNGDRAQENQDLAPHIQDIRSRNMCQQKGKPNNRSPALPVHLIEAHREHPKKHIMYNGKWPATKQELISKYWN